MRLIDADALFNKLDNTPWYDNADRDEIALPAIDGASIVDDVPVIRCKDCKYYSMRAYGRVVCWCNRHDIVVEDTDFCSRGELREDDRYALN